MSLSRDRYMIGQQLEMFGEPFEQFALCSPARSVGCRAWCHQNFCNIDARMPKAIGHIT
jgi:hypothetical protein